jgi:predicted nucleic acid-binding protein
VKFVDSSFWIALQFRRDSHFDEATELWRYDQGPLLTTNFVMGESWTFLRRRLGFDAARNFVDFVESSKRTTILRVDETAEAAAWAWLRRHDERVYSFVDATSFAVMRQLSVAEALAFDGDFSAAGFVELRP